MSYSKTFKICLLADEDVGKKTLIRKYLDPYFKEERTMTLGVEFSLLDVEVHEERIKLQFWVLSDEPRFRFHWNSYLLGSNGIILMYDITNAKSLNMVSKVIPIIKNEIKYDIPVLLVGNKLDFKGIREVSKQHIEIFKKNNGISESIEISLQTGENVEEMLMTFIGMIEGKTIDKRDFSMFICPKCKAKMEKLTHFCGKCGADLRS